MSGNSSNINIFTRLKNAMSQLTSSTTNTSIFNSKQQQSSNNNPSSSSSPQNSPQHQQSSLPYDISIQSAERWAYEFPYVRPHFLNLNAEEVSAANNTMVRPVIVPKRINKMPMCAGYAECMNAHKTIYNEDQATALIMDLNTGNKIIDPTDKQKSQTDLEMFTYFAIFDGHDGAAAAILASKYLHFIIRDNLACILPDLKASFNSVISVDCNLNDSMNKNDTDTYLLKSFIETYNNNIYDSNNDNNNNNNNNNNNSDNNNNNNNNSLVEHNIYGDSSISNAIKSCRSNGDINNTNNISDKNNTNNNNSHNTNNINSSKVIPNELPAYRWSMMSREQKTPTFVDMVVGAIEVSFMEMDEKLKVLLKEGRSGCAVIAAILFGGHLFVANAGDCRAVLKSRDRVISASMDFTPEMDQRRIRMKAHTCPHLLGDIWTPMEYIEHPHRGLIGTSLFYRDPWMSGWYKRVIQPTDIKPPILYGKKRRSRLLQTIGLSRGFGDHSLKVYNTDVCVKPFLSCVPEVRSCLLSDLKAMDFLILASDGLWDVVTEEEAVQCVNHSLANAGSNNPKRYTIAAQDLAMEARGTDIKNWNTIDDISVFIIPLDQPINRLSEQICTTLNSSSESEAIEINSSTNQNEYSK
ncbi:hypothetical protein HELRODRAFT_190263 [Helobdella robusta]|uniref:PPM-type phosphatase domain-containing protein n=1 Tax=Helobdella robusta TaxID=6412 RepID=T1FRU1_HELRO|nr:hypothetical protein HELRODRAFT_190263 [Helobdella robusta]ESO10992.1 hypothetical protein HELRODRAFT_190263 [Helobdella robusta]